MVEVFNRLDIEASCLGNHDLDFGVERMTELV
jgi:5'-nucleotidase